MPVRPVVEVIAFSHFGTNTAINSQLMHMSKPQNVAVNDVLLCKEGRFSNTNYSN